MNGSSLWLHSLKTVPSGMYLSSKANRLASVLRIHFPLGIFVLLKTYNLLESKRKKVAKTVKNKNGKGINSYEQKKKMTYRRTRFWVRCTQETLITTGRGTKPLVKKSWWLLFEEEGNEKIYSDGCYSKKKSWRGRSTVKEKSKWEENDKSRASYIPSIPLKRRLHGNCSIIMTPRGHDGYLEKVVPLTKEDTTRGAALAMGWCFLEKINENQLREHMPRQRVSKHPRSSFPAELACLGGNWWGPKIMTWFWAQKLSKPIKLAQDEPKPKR